VHWVRELVLVEGVLGVLLLLPLLHRLLRHLLLLVGLLLLRGRGFLFLRRGY
jgi:hypothetical protein